MEKEPQQHPFLEKGASEDVVAATSKDGTGDRSMHQMGRESMSGAQARQKCKEMFDMVASSEHVLRQLEEALALARATKLNSRRYRDDEIEDLSPDQPDGDEENNNSRSPKRGVHGASSAGAGGPSGRGKGINALSGSINTRSSSTPKHGRAAGSSVSGPGSPKSAGAKSRRWQETALRPRGSNGAGGDSNTDVPGAAGSEGAAADGVEGGVTAATAGPSGHRPHVVAWAGVLRSPSPTPAPKSAPVRAQHFAHMDPPGASSRSQDGSDADSDGDGEAEGTLGDTLSVQRCGISVPRSAGRYSSGPSSLTSLRPPAIALPSPAIKAPASPAAHEHQASPKSAQGARPLAGIAQTGSCPGSPKPPGSSTGNSGPLSPMPSSFMLYRFELPGSRSHDHSGPATGPSPPSQRSAPDPDSTLLEAWDPFCLPSPAATGHPTAAEQGAAVHGSPLHARPHGQARLQADQWAAAAAAMSDVAAASFLRSSLSPTPGTHAYHEPPGAATAAAAAALHACPAPGRSGASEAGRPRGGALQHSQLLGGAGSPSRGGWSGPGSGPGAAAGGSLSGSLSGPRQRLAAGVVHAAGSRAAGQGVSMGQVAAPSAARSLRFGGCAGMCEEDHGARGSGLRRAVSDAELEVMRASQSGNTIAPAAAMDAACAASPFSHTRPQLRGHEGVGKPLAGPTLSAGGSSAGAAPPHLWASSSQGGTAHAGASAGQLQGRAAANVHWLAAAYASAPGPSIPPLPVHHHPPSAAGAGGAHTSASNSAPLPRLSDPSTAATHQAGTQSPTAAASGLAAAAGAGAAGAGVAAIRLRRLSAATPQSYGSVSSPQAAGPWGRLARPGAQTAQEVPQHRLASSLSSPNTSLPQLFKTSIDSLTRLMGGARGGGVEVAHAAKGHAGSPHQPAGGGHGLGGPRSAMHLNMMSGVPGAAPHSAHQLGRLDPSGKRLD